MLKILHISGAVIVLYANLIIKSSELQSNFWVGSYAAFLSVLFAVMTIIGGRLADKHAAKKVLCNIEIISSLCILIFLYINNIRYLPICFAIVSGLYNLSTPTITLLMLKQRNNDDMDKDSNGIFSILLIMSNIGIVIWSYVISRLPSIKYMLWFFLAINIIIAAVSLFLPNMENKVKQGDTGYEENSFRDVIKWIVKDGKGLLLFMLLMIIFSIMLSHLNVSIPLLMDGLFGEKGDLYFSYIIIENAIVLIICTWIIHFLVRKLEEVPRLIISSALYMIAFVMLFFSKNLFLIGVAIFFFSCGEIISNTTSNSFVLKCTPPRYIATCNSLYNVLSGSGTVIGPLLSTLLLERNGINAVWIFSILLLGFTIIVFLIWLNYQSHCRR